MAPIVDKNSKDIVVQGAVPLLLCTSSVQTDGQVEAVATQAIQVSTRSRKGTSWDPVPPSGGVGPQAVGAQALVVHGVPTYMLVDEILWHANKLRLGVGERVNRAH